MTCGTISNGNVIIIKTGWHHLKFHSFIWFVQQFFFVFLAHWHTDRHLLLLLPPESCHAVAIAAGRHSAHLCVNIYLSSAYLFKFFSDFISVIDFGSMFLLVKYQRRRRDHSCNPIGHFFCGHHNAHGLLIIIIPHIEHNVATTRRATSSSLSSGTTQSKLIFPLNFY